MHSVSFNSLGNLGRIGNQLFQLSALLFIAKENKFDFLLPSPTEVEREDYILHEIFDLSNLISKNNYGISNFHDFDKNLIPNDIEYSNSYLNLGRDTNLNGYFQSLQFIEPIKDLLLEHLKFNNYVKNASEKILLKNNINPEDYSFIHIRRGDYINKKAYHYNLDKSYYKKSIKKFPKDRKYLIFSDDPAWCNKYLNLKNESIIFDHLYEENIQSYLKIGIELYIMSICNGGIIANSSYSWWAAFLQNKNSLIISPDKNAWFGYKYSFDARGLIHKNWTTCLPALPMYCINLFKKKIFYKYVKT